LTAWAFGQVTALDRGADGAAGALVATTPACRLHTWTDQEDGVTTTKTHHHDSDGDNPALTDEGTGTYTRAISAISDVTAIRGTDGAVQFQLANLHGDIAVSASANLPTQPGLLNISDNTEYGTPRDASTIGTRRYGWLGSGRSG